MFLFHYYALWSYPVAGPDHELGGGGGEGGEKNCFACPAGLYSFCDFFFFTQNKRGAVPRAPPLDPPLLILGSLRSFYGYAEDSVDYKMNSYFTYESRYTFKSVTFFITVKVITRLNLGHRGKFEIEFQKISRRSLRSPDNAKFSHFTLLFCRGR